MHDPRGRDTIVAYLFTALLGALVAFGAWLRVYGVEVAPGMPTRAVHLAVAVLAALCVYPWRRDWALGLALLLLGLTAIELPLTMERPGPGADPVLPQELARRLAENIACALALACACRWVGARGTRVRPAWWVLVVAGGLVSYWLRARAEAARVTGPEAGALMVFLVAVLVITILTAFGARERAVAHRRRIGLLMLIGFGVFYALRWQYAHALYDSLAGRRGDLRTQLLTQYFLCVAWPEQIALAALLLRAGAGGADEEPNPPDRTAR